MLSRRSVRVKVMQLIFAASRDSDLVLKDLKKVYNERLHYSFELFLFNVFCLARITSHSEQDAAKRKNKHLPSEYDKAFTSKIYNNEIIQDIVNNKYLKVEFDKYDFSSRLADGYTSKIYDEFSKTDHYKEYVLAKSNKRDTIEILLELYRFCRQNEFFNDLMEDSSYTWIDDKSLVVGAVKKYIKSLPSLEQKSYRDQIPDEETTEEFGMALMEYTFDNDAELLDHITPILENWDHERLAIIDTILLKMAIAEFMIFPTIPVNVTINEYMEVAKKYSTAKSKDFLNGILDKLSKELLEKNLVNKAGRGLEE